MAPEMQLKGSLHERIGSREPRATAANGAMEKRATRAATAARIEIDGYPRILRTTAGQGSGATSAAGPVSNARLPGTVDGTDAVRRPRNLAVHAQGWCEAARELELERI